MWGKSVLALRPPRLQLRELSSMTSAHSLVMSLSEDVSCSIHCFSCTPHNLHTNPNTKVLFDNGKVSSVEPLFLLVRWREPLSSADPTSTTSPSTSVSRRDTPTSLLTAHQHLMLARETLCPLASAGKLLFVILYILLFLLSLFSTAHNCIPAQFYICTYFSLLHYYSSFSCTTDLKSDLRCASSLAFKSRGP